MHVPLHLPEQLSAPLAVHLLRLADRAASLAEPQRLRPLIPGIRARMNELLGKAVEVVRARFGGEVSYASVPLDGVDWGPFDIISTDAGYRTAQMAARA